MREMGLWDTDEGLEKTFADIEQFAKSCRFADCKHQSEPGCAIVAAIESGELSATRWQSYQKLSAEQSYAEDAAAYLAAKEQKFRAISKFAKSGKKGGTIR
jgi:ribosome biogenesis GTPase